MKEIILDVIKNYDAKKRSGRSSRWCLCSDFPGFMEMTAVLLYVVSMMMTTDFMWNIIIRFFRGTGITTQEQVTVERHADKDAIFCSL